MNQDINFRPDKTGRLTPEASKKYFSRIGLACFILGTVSLLISVSTNLIVRELFPWILDDPIVSTILPFAISVVGLYVFAFPLASLAMGTLPSSIPMKEKMKTSHVIAGLCISFMLTFVGSYASTFLYSLTASSTDVASSVSTDMTDTQIIISGIFLALVLPILEELVFRKFLCSRLLPLGEGYAVFFSAIIFALMGELYEIPHAFLLGLFFSFIYVKTGKIIYTIIFHCAINLYNGVLGIYMSAKLPIDDILKIFESDVSDSEKMAQLAPYWDTLQIYIWTSAALIGLIIAGFIICYRAVKKERFKLESGIIPPSKTNRVSNILCAGGIAAAVGYIGIKIVLPLYVERFL